MNTVKIALLLALAPLCVSAQMNYFQVPNPPGIGTSNVRSNALAVDPGNGIWTGFAVYGAGNWNGSAWTIYNSSNSGLPSDSVTAIAFEGNGDGWFGTKLGAAFKQGGNWTVYNTGNSGLPANIITAIYIDGNTKWFGSYAGLTSFDGSLWTTYNTQNSGLTNDSVMVIRKDNNGALWVGTRNGFSRFINNTWTSWNTQNSGISRSVYDIECHPSGETWIASANINTIGIYANARISVVGNNIVEHFEEARYYYEKEFTYYGAELAIDSQSRIHFLSANPSRSVMQLGEDGLQVFTFSQPNIGTASAGCRMIFDGTGKLWMLSRVSLQMGYVDLNTYNPDFSSNWIHNYRESDINDMAVGINSSGDMHWDFADPKHEVPKGSGKHSVFASALWIGGLDSGGNLHMAAQTYRQTGVDYWPGPIDGISVPFDSSTCIAFDRVWKVDKWKVEQFKTEFLAGNVTNGSYKVPEEFATWPAKGNGIVDEEMAPFVDYNGDGVYDPMDGDYPLIKGDQMLWRVFNDSLVVHTGSGAPRMGIEVRSHAYAFGCWSGPDSLEVLNRSTFYKYEIINRSPRVYSNVYIGLWVDVDLGNYLDDLIGCDSTRAAGFVYNGDNNDDGAAGYGMNPPMQNIKILKGPLADPQDAIDNDLDGFVDEPGERCTMNHFMTYNNVNNSPVGNPQQPIDYYYYMQSTWLNGQHLTYGGDGANPANAPVDFYCSGVPYSGTGWTEMATTLPSDRRFLMSSGPFTLVPGDTAEIDFAYIFTWDSLSPNGLMTSIARNQADLDRVQYWFENNNFPSCETFTTGVSDDKQEKLQVFPNPVDDKLYLKSNFGKGQNLQYTIYNSLGEVVSSGSLKGEAIRVDKLTPQFYILKISDGHREQTAGFIKR
jgi:hypothetical protein